MQPAHGSVVAFDRFDAWPAGAVVVELVVDDVVDGDDVHAHGSLVTATGPAVACTTAGAFATAMPPSAAISRLIHSPPVR